MKKIEAKTLEEAYAIATEAFHCSITALDCEIIQYPSSGFLGLFSKNAIIVVAAKKEQEEVPVEPRNINNAVTDHKKPAEKNESSKPIDPLKQKETVSANSMTESVVLDSFFEEKEVHDTVVKSTEKPSNNIPLQEEIEEELKALITLSCFDIDIVEVDVIEDTAYVFIDGEDAALLIGKEGYRYNALSYLISNWLQNKHALYIKLEIAQFLASQQEMIRSYMEPVIEHVEQEGWGRTRALDGILVQIALEQLREAFPNKYVAIKRTRNGDRYVLINEFNKR